MSEKTNINISMKSMDALLKSVTGLDALLKSLRSAQNHVDESDGYAGIKLPYVSAEPIREAEWTHS